MIEPSRSTTAKPRRATLSPCRAAYVGLEALECRTLLSHPFAGVPAPRTAHVVHVILPAGEADVDVGPGIPAAAAARAVRGHAGGAGNHAPVLSLPGPLTTSPGATVVFTAAAGDQVAISD